MRQLCGGLLLCLLLGFDSTLHAAAVPMSVRGMDIEFPLFSVFMLPGEELTIAVDRAQSGELLVEHDAAIGSYLSALAWNLKAPPDPGIFQMEIHNADGSFRTQLNLIVLVPFDRVREGELNGYRIGNYPQPRPGRSQYYPLPDGFIEVTADNRNTQLSPHFTLAQLLCKQESAYPKYLVLREKLLVLLEDLLAEVSSQGYAIDTFGFISGYRTPYYNRKIGNVKYSRHIYGDAADIFIDSDGDGRMDDVNADGVLNRKDIQVFYDIANRFKAARVAKGYVGGLGLYKNNARHGGFVHVDTRGYRARW